MDFQVVNLFSDSIRFDKAAADEQIVPEYDIKAVYLYNFLLFIQWPEFGEDPGDGQPDSDPIHKEHE